MKSILMKTLWMAWKMIAPCRLTSRAPALMSVGTNIIALAFLFVAGAAAQQPQATLDSNAIMGFETPSGWTAKGDPDFGTTLLSATTIRTQGSFALQVKNPGDAITLTSLPVASTAEALEGVGDAGAFFDVDVMLPNHAGLLQLLVSSNSRGLHNVQIGKVQFTGLRLGIYTTLKFPIPDQVSDALAGRSFNDLTFQFILTLPEQETSPGTLRFDNLRVHSAPLVQSPTGTPPPPGYGGSVNLVVFGDAPVTQTFNLGPAQIPNSFHLKLGTVGTTTVELQLGLDGKPTLTCTYDHDATDPAGQFYILDSCAGGFQAGDLVNANWVHMAIVNGNHTQQIRAQLTLNPIGELVGAGLIPPMPTFWGDADTCIPAAVAGKVVTTSASCSNQTAQANQIITNYFNQVHNANPAPNWIVAPVPEFALRHGNGKPNNNLKGPLTAPSDPPFDTGGDLNPGGTFDAYWRLNGNLTPTAVTGTDENITHFDATFASHGVLFGQDVDVLDVKVVADTDSGETTPTFKPATSTGTLGFFVFGQEIPPGGFTVNPSTGFSVDPTWSQEFNLPPIEIWIFTITLGATANAELKASGAAALSGLDLSVTPSASLGAHVSGGINVVVASGTVDAKVNLVTLSTPVTAQAKWVLNDSPKVCAATLNGSLKGDLNLSSGGGQVNLDATFGVCPLCYTDTTTLFKWGALASTTLNIFNDAIQVQLFGLPASLCPFPITVKIVVPTSGASLVAGLPITLTGSAKPNDPTLAINSSTYNWTYTPGAHASTVTVHSGKTTANPNITFGPPTSGSSSTWTIKLSATDTVSSAGGTQIKSTASASPVTITVTALPPSVNITELLGADGSIFTPNAGFIDATNATNYTVVGLVAGASGTLNTTFTFALCTDGTVACTSPGPATALTTTNASSTTPSASLAGLSIVTYYKITMSTTVNGSTFGQSSAIVLLDFLL